MTEIVPWDLIITDYLKGGTPAKLEEKYKKYKLTRSQIKNYMYVHGIGKQKKEISKTITEGLSQEINKSIKKKQKGIAKEKILTAKQVLEGLSYLALNGESDTVKKSAYDSLAKHYKLLTDKIEQEVKEIDKTPIEVRILE